MVFLPPSWVPPLPFDIPDSLTIEQFMTSEQHGAVPLAQRRNPFTCGLTGRTHTWPEVVERTDLLARALSRRLGWQPNGGTPWDKVAGVFALNTVDYTTVLHAVHRFSGIVSPANAAYSAAELQHQLRAAGARVLFTCAPLLPTALEAARAVGIPAERIFLMAFPGPRASAQHATIDELIAEAASAKLPPLEPLRWTAGQGTRQTAFLCFSSGTSGLPKAVMISHRNVIANIVQQVTYESHSRQLIGLESQAVLGLLPFSHIYGLVVIAHGNPYRGDAVVVLPRFELEPFLGTIQKYRLDELYLVPPILVRMLHEQATCARYDLRSVRCVFSGAAPLGEEVVAELGQRYPGMVFCQGYGMTETATVVCATSEHDVLPGSSGSLMPGCRARIVALDGSEVTELDTPGELLVQSPSVVLGYLNNEQATAETFVHDAAGQRWIRTGDEVVITRAPLSGNEHIVIVDRIKELIKVKGHQVAPAELEAHLLTHPAVEDATVIPVPDGRAGEVPKAFVVKANPAESDEVVAAAVVRHVQDHKSSYKWLKGGVEFLSSIPKSPSGKILRRLLRDQDKAKRGAAGAKL